MSNQKKVIIIAGVFVIAITGMLLTVIFSLGLTEKSAPDLPKSTEESIVEEFPEIDSESAFEDSDTKSSDDLKNQYDAIGSDEAEPLTKEVAQIILSNTYSRLYKMNFTEALQYLNSEISKHAITEDSESFKVLDDLYRDLSKMAQIQFAIDNGDEDMAIGIIESLEQPHNHLVSTLSLNRELRESIIRNADSLNPIFDGDVVWGKSISEPIYEIRTSYDILEVKKIPFEIENNKLIADYLYTTEGLMLYKIYEETEGSTQYMSIREWRTVMNPGSSIDEELNEDDLGPIEENNEEVTNEE